MESGEESDRWTYDRGGAVGSGASWVSWNRCLDDLNASPQRVCLFVFLVLSVWGGLSGKNLDSRGNIYFLCKKYPRNSPNTFIFKCQKKLPLQGIN